MVGSRGYYRAGSFPAELDRIGRVAQHFDKPVILRDAGCQSRTGSPDKSNR
ncbi:glycoside hydrolase family 113 [Cryobacterium sp. MP_M5]|uniref:glycoside hydrolase family 113 n=1 Tax=Cryobacterium sp. MP_M5 TaxID=3071715 RepID=UPI003FA3A554